MIVLCNSNLGKMTYNNKIFIMIVLCDGNSGKMAKFLLEQYLKL